MKLTDEDKGILELIVVDLTAQINMCKSKGEDIYSADWSEVEGVLISCYDAEFILKFLNGIVKKSL